MQLKKSLGQNFLIDEDVLTHFVNSMELNGDEVVLEIGPGDGRVTKEIAKKALKVIAVEFDRDLIPTLKTNLKDFNNVEIINADILDYLNGFKISPPFAKASEGKDLRFKIVGSIPYSITSPLIHKIFLNSLIASSLQLTAFIVQLEVAKKIISRPPKATYLSNLVQIFGVANITERIPPTAFHPEPKVFSAILKIIPTQKSDISNQKSFLNLIHKGFQHPRKMLNKVFEKDLLLKIDIDPSLRPANLSLEDWVKLFQIESLTKC